MADKLPKTAFFSRNSQGMVLIEDQARSTGIRLFVNSGGGGADTTGYGVSPEQPLLTLDAAINQCTADENDIIYLMPGHAETIEDATTAVVDVDGISIIALGNGANRATLTFDDAASSIVIDGNNVLVEGLRCISSDDDVVTAFNITGTDVTIRGCSFIEATATKSFLICITTGALLTANNFIVEDCIADLIDAANTHFINIPGTPNGGIIRNNYLMGDWGTMCIGGAGVATNLVVVDNLIYNIATDVDSCISLAAASGICARNICGGGANVVNGVTATLMTEAENYYQKTTSDLSGVLDPANA